MPINESINGRRVKTFHAGYGLETSEYFNFANKPDLVATVINVYHGNRDENWLIIEKNGVEIQRIGINQYSSITWWEAKDA